LDTLALYEVQPVFYGPEWEDIPLAKNSLDPVLKTLKEHADIWGNLYGYHFKCLFYPSERF